MIIQIDVHGELFATDAANNVFHIETQGGIGGPPYTQAKADITAWLQDMYGEMIGSLHNEFLLNDYTVSEVSEVDGKVTELFTESISFQGGAVTEEMPNQVAGSIYIGVEGTARKARKSLSGIAAVHISGNLFNATGLDNLVDFAQQWADGPGTIGGALAFAGMWSRKFLMFHRASGFVAANVVCGSADSRKPGVGA